MPKLSVTIITKNEAADIGAALDSVSWADERIVVDSCSTDETVYLFDLFPARASVYGAGSLEEFLAFGPKMSLKAQGLLDRPSAPMLLVNGNRDTQVPIADLDVMLHSGSPKEAWVNPDGGHMGRSTEWPVTSS